MIEERTESKVYKIIMLIIITVILSSFGTILFIRKFGIDIIDKEIKVQSVNDVIDLPDYLDQIQKTLQRYYLGDINNEKLIEGAIKGYVNGLNDPYTEYFTKDEMKEFETETEGEYVGIGIYMGATKNNEIIVISPIKGSPAEKIGIESGDIIAKIDDKEYSAEEMTAASNYIKGKEGTTVNLEILRDKEIKEFKVERAKVDLAPIESKILDGNIGYLSISAFDENCSEEVKTIIEDFNNKGVNGIILDLRNNGGGLVDEALSILELFTNKGDKLLITVDKNKKEKVQKSKKDPITDKKLVILVNEGSASASEIVAGTLKDLNRATIVGKTTYGKGVIQMLIPISDGSGLKVTIEEYFTSGHNKIHEIGITPDVEAENDKDTEGDEQLKKAEELFK